MRVSKPKYFSYLAAVYIIIRECYQALGAVHDEEMLPIIVEDVANLTVVSGREAVLSCHVDHLGSYKVAWVRVDTQTILTIHNSIITRNQRVSLSHREHKEWKLHISNVQESDRGWYLCQVNTEPMRSKRGYLEVTVPPAIVDARSSADLVVREKDRVNLTCQARGYPTPKVLWRREDGEDIVARERGKTVSGGSLVFESVGRGHIGTYLCIASNGVPPSVSKRVELKVQFPPMMTVPSQLERSLLGGRATLRCRSEAFPASINYWIREGTGIVNTDENHTVSLSVQDHVTQMKLEITNVQMKDFATYRCVSKNSLGETDGKLRLHRIESGEDPIPEEEEEFSPSTQTYLSTLPTYRNYPKKKDWSHRKQERGNSARTQEDSAAEVERRLYFEHEGSQLPFSGSAVIQWTMLLYICPLLTVSLV